LEAIVYDLPAPIWFLVLAGVLGITASACFVLARGALAAGQSREAAGRLAAAAGAVLLAWLGLASYLAGQRVFAEDPQDSAGVPWIGVALAAVLTGLLLSVRIPAVHTALSGPDTPVRLAGPQVFRVVGGTFLIVMVLGELSPVFAIPAGLGDIAVGVAAVVLLRRSRRGRPRPAALVWFNVLGLVDLVVAITLGVLAAPGALQVLTATPSTEAATLLPLSLVPTVAVPLALALHLVSLHRLALARRALLVAR
jgi:hypothetical protein